MKAVSPKEELVAARLRWKEASADLAGRKLLSDMELDIQLLEKARAFPVWRGLVGLGGSWLLPQMPIVMGQPDAFAMAVFQILGGLSLGAAVWFLGKDGILWMRWFRARRALKKGHYTSPVFKRLFPTGAGGLTPLDRESPQWRELEQWSKREPQIHAVWQKWNKSIAPVRQDDAKAMSEAVFAITALRDLKGA